MLQGGHDVSNFVRSMRKPKPKHRQRRVYVETGVLKGMAIEKPLPENVWKSIKKAVGIEGKFVPPEKESK